jgi:TRAP-type C4-dicarboxylate transport system substrate-binding protein
MKRLLVSLFLLPFAFCLSSQAQTPVTIRLGSVVPAGTIWSNILKEQAAEWGKLSGGRVRLVVMAGTQGDEDAIIRKIRTSGQLNAAALSIIGLGNLDSAFNVFSIPMFFESYDELHHVMDKLEPTLKARLEARDFVFVNWANGGWLQVFSKRPVKTVADIKSMKIFTSAGHEETVQWYKKNGFQPVPLSAPDMLPGLTTGMIEAIPATPLAALSFQWYKHTPYMAEIGLGPFIGATVVTKKAWDQITPDDRAKLLEAAGRFEQRFRSEVPKSDQTATVVMQKSGLTVIQVDAAARAEWRAMAEGFTKTMRAGMVPADVFELALRERDAFRKQRPR